MNVDWSLLLDRALWLGVGMIIGTAFGYTVRAKREAHEALERVHDLEDEFYLPKGERGAIRLPRKSEIALFLVVSLTAWAAWGSARVSNDLDQTVTCLEQYNQTLGEALVERDGDAADVLAAEIDLWTKYDRLFKLARAAENADDQRTLTKLQNEFYRDVRAYNSNLKELRRTRGELPYPTAASLVRCTQEG